MIVSGAAPLDGPALVTMSVTVPEPPGARTGDDATMARSALGVPTTTDAGVVLSAGCGSDVGLDTVATPSDEVPTAVAPGTSKGIETVAAVATASPPATVHVTTIGVPGADGDAGVEQVAWSTPTAVPAGNR